jgi:hypothetical protein
VVDTLAGFELHNVSSRRTEVPPSVMTTGYYLIKFSSLRQKIDIVIIFCSLATVFIAFYI